MKSTYLNRRFPTFSILFVVILFISKLTFATDFKERLPYKNFIEQNKTWWYQSAIFHGPYVDFYYFGIKIEEDTIIDDTQWSKCWLIDVEKNRMLPFPIALIREENKKIYRYLYDDELDDLRYEYSNNTDNEYLRNIFRGDICSSRCMYERIGDWEFSFEDVLSSPADYPLYDFSSEKKHQIWPWSYLDNFQHGWGIQLDFEIPMAINDYDGREFQAYRIFTDFKIDINGNIVPSESSSESYIDREAIIVEGVGIHRLDYERCGTFLLPADNRYGITGYVWMPTLLMVTLNNDLEVYFRGSYGRGFSPDNIVHTGQIIENLENIQRIYDIMGNEIKKPTPGNIYISNGHKIIWK